MLAPGFKKLEFAAGVELVPAAAGALSASLEEKRPPPKRFGFGAEEPLDDAGTDVEEGTEDGLLNRLPLPNKPPVGLGASEDAGVPVVDGAVVLLPKAEAGGAAAAGGLDCPKRLPAVVEPDAGG